MQRTRIVTKLLVGLAVTAVSGCVTVEPAAVPSPRPGAGGPVQDVAPQIVQPPAREALEAVPDPSPSPSAARRSSPAPPAAGSPTAPRRTGPAGSARPEPPHRRAPHRSRAEPPVGVPVLPRVPGGADVCALGRGYGTWPAGSPQSRICSEVYGR
ncbi:hypothetical protein ACFV2V_18080 [Streptomyces sp. NPDC059698]|uniref:hypothetical protein n=1 Tax=unclassified Streptomyces TaxID=2593676 RepID=UPI00093E2356|nr:hypothetical protein [Streptomyces sp. CB02366]OKJ34730.1 hypothetical protein AMK24_20725 [Streptomyces sp. CB02366]